MATKTTRIWLVTEYSPGNQLHKGAWFDRTLADAKQAKLTATAVAKAARWCKVCGGNVLHDSTQSFTWHGPHDWVPQEPESRFEVEFLDVIGELPNG